MSPSSKPPVSERAIVCQQGGELAEFVSLLAELAIPVDIHAGPLPTLEQVAGAALVVVAGQRLTESRNATLHRWPRTIAVVDDGSRTLNAHLTRVGVSLILRRPVHPRALRLLLLHALYRGPERRGKQRVMIGQSIRAGVGLFKQDATLLELSRTGARIELASPPRIGTPIQFVLGKELTQGKPIKLQAKVVRAIRAADPAGRTTSEIGVALVDPHGEHARAVQAILDRHASRIPAPTPSGRTTPDAVPAQSPGPARTTPTTADDADAVRPATGTKPSPRPFATASLTALSRSLATPTPTVFAAPTPGSTSAPARSAAPKPSLPAQSPPAPRRLPPCHEPQPIRALSTEAVSIRPTTAPTSPLDGVVLAESAPTEVESIDALVGDESDLDFELELDDEIDAGIPGELRSNAVLAGERRESTRVPYSQRVVALDEQAARVVVGRDLSAGGMRIAPNPELAVGDVVKLALHAGTETASLVVLAGVERDDGEDGLLLAFSALTPSQRERLDEILTATSSILSADPLDESYAGEPIVMGEVLRRVSRGPVGTARAGFTLIELMIVVAIIGIISSVALPLFGRYQLRTKSAEAKTNLSAIRVVQEAYQSEHGRYLAADAEPPLIPGRLPASFDFVGTDYAEMGWGPEGRVYFSYAVAISPDATGYTADAAADIDDDGILQIWGYAKADPLGALTPGGLGCNPAVLGSEEIGSCVVGATSF